MRKVVLSHDFIARYWVLFTRNLVIDIELFVICGPYIRQPRYLHVNYIFEKILSFGINPTIDNKLPAINASQMFNAKVVTVSMIINCVVQSCALNVEIKCFILNVCRLNKTSSDTLTLQRSISRHKAYCVVARNSFSNLTGLQPQRIVSAIQFETLYLKGESGAVRNIWYASRTHFKPKSRELSFPHNLFLSFLSVLKFVTEHGNDMCKLCKISKRLDNWNRCCGPTLFSEIWVQYEFRAEILYCTTP